MDLLLRLAHHQDGNILATVESSIELIAAACRALDGQALSEFSFQRQSGESEFTFDLGGGLTTYPYSDDLLEQWMLYSPDKYVLVYRSDGAFSHGRSDTTHGEFSQIESG